MKCSDLEREVIFSNSKPPWVLKVKDQITKKQFARNCMKCPDLLRKLMFINSHPHKGGVEGGGQFPKKLFSLEIECNVQICTENHVLGTDFLYNRICFLEDTSFRQSY